MNLHKTDIVAWINLSPRKLHVDEKRLLGRLQLNANFPEASEVAVASQELDEKGGRMSLGVARGNAGGV